MKSYVLIVISIIQQIEKESQVLCQHIIVGRDSEIAPTDRLLMVGGNSDSRLLSSPIN